MFHLLLYHNKTPFYYHFISISILIIPLIILLGNLYVLTMILIVIISYHFSRNNWIYTDINTYDITNYPHLVINPYRQCYSSLSLVPFLEWLINLSDNNTHDIINYLHLVINTCRQWYSSLSLIIFSQVTSQFMMISIPMTLLIILI